jgi:OmpA-OmpF porin, OOP family
MKKLFALLIVAFIMVVGCAGGKGGNVVATGPCLTPAAPIAKAAPAPAPVVVAPVLKELIVYFDFDKSALKDMKPSEVAKMKDLVAFLKANPGVEVKLTGHTDWYGSDAYNMKLSEKRNNTVKTYLVDNGIGATRISTLAKGESELVSKTDAKLNRRVVVIQIK